MGPRQTAVNTLSYSTGSRPKAEAGRASAKTIGTGVCERPPRGGLRCGPRLDQRSSGPVGGGWRSAKTGFLDAEPTPSRFPAERRGDQDVVGSHLVNNVLLTQAASRAALHVKIGSRT
jgi:hypothetical protein